MSAQRLPEPALEIRDTEAFDRDMDDYVKKNGTILHKIALFFGYRVDAAYYHPHVPGAAPRIVVTPRGLRRRDIQKLLAHEYGHYLGYDHPSTWNPLFYLDVMGYGLRWLDVNGVYPASAKWRAQNNSAIDLFRKKS